MSARKVVCLILLIAAGIACVANMLPTSDEWYSKHYFIMQKFENDAYKAMSPDARLKFQELFWTARSPAAKNEFETRMAYIANEFKNENAAQPWNTDRARVYLLNGNPGSRDYTTDDRWAGNPAGKAAPEGLTDDRMGEDVQARTMEIWKYPIPGGFFAPYGFAFNRPNKWKQANPSTQDARYVGQFELKNRKEVWGAQDEGSYKKRIAELASGMDMEAGASITPPPVSEKPRVDAEKPVARPAPTINPAQEQAGNPELIKILALARKYCARLDRAALDFVCKERVKEESNTRPAPVGTKVYPSSLYTGRDGAMKTAAAAPEHFNTVNFVYDYMFVRKAGEVKEKRDLVNKNGEELEKKDVGIETRHFKFNDIFFGASILLGEAAAAEHVYAFVENDKIKREPVVVVACEAKPESAKNVLTGKAWIRAKDGAVLRISWNPESFGDYQNVLLLADGLKMDPAIESETEFGIEHNGLLFPTRDRTEETYKKGSMSFTRSMVTVTYDGYKFFTVETGIEIK